MRHILSRADPHPFAGMDVAWLVAERAESRRDHPFIIWEPFDSPAEVITYGQFHARIGRIAGGLARRGVRAGDCVLIHLENCPETLLAWYACAWIGAVAVTTNARASDDELTYYADHCGAVAGITQPRFAVGSPVELPLGRLTSIGAFSPRRYDMTPDGRILGIVSSTQTPAGAVAAPEIQVVLNWFEELKARVPTK